MKDYIQELKKEIAIEELIFKKERKKYTIDEFIEKKYYINGLKKALDIAIKFYEYEIYAE